MRNRLFLYLIIVLPLVSLYSCQKEISSENGIAPVVPLTIDSNYLSKIYAFDINGSSADTVEVVTYNYDNLKRVTSVVDSSKNLYNATQQSYFYFYNNSDTLPYKSVRYQVSAEDPALTQLTYDTIISYHLYDNAGRNLKDSGIHSNSSILNGYYSTYTVKQYSYALNRIYGYASSNPISVPYSFVSPDEKDTAVLDALGNIIDNKIYRYNSYTSLWELSITSAFTYDTKASPFSRLSNFKTFGVFPNGETFYGELPQKTNRVTQNEHHSFSNGAPGVHFDYSYFNSYNANGLVKGISVYDQPPNPTMYSKIILVYKAL